MYEAMSHNNNNPLPVKCPTLTGQSVDRAKLKGYYLHWTNAKYILGCALFTDILTPCSIFSKVMLNDEVDM